MSEHITLTNDERDALGPFIWGGWIGVAAGREVDFSRDLQATVEQIVAARVAAELRNAIDEVQTVYDLQCPPRGEYVPGARMAHRWWEIVLGGTLRRLHERAERIGRVTA